MRFMLLSFLVIATSACTLATENRPGVAHKVPILHSIGGDFPVAALDLLPEGQRLNPVGYLGSQSQLDAVVEHLQSGGKTLPTVDFTTQLVLFARNTRFYNRLSIGAVTLAGATFEILSMSTMSAMPIEEKVVMSLVVVERGGAKFIDVNGVMVEIE
jgi:hypothetical protein